MLKQCQHLIRQIDAYLSGREKHLSVGSQYAACEELSVLPTEARTLIEPYGVNAAVHCAWELAGLDKAARTALNLAGTMTLLTPMALGRCRDEFNTRIEECEQWIMRAQAEAYTAAGPTMLPLINLAFIGRAGHDEISVRCHLYSALDQGEATLEGAFHTTSERQAWEGLTQVLRDILKADKPQALTPLLEACHRIELALAEAEQWTPWPTLNRLLSVAAGVVFGTHPPAAYVVQSRLLKVELDTTEQRTLSQARRLVGADHDTLIKRLERCFATLHDLLSDLTATVGERKPHAVAPCARRLRWTLTDLAVCQSELDVLPDVSAFVACAFCHEQNGMDRTVCQHCSAILPGSVDTEGEAAALPLFIQQDNRATTDSPVVPKNLQPVVHMLEAYCAGDVSGEDLEGTLVALQTRLEETTAHLAEHSETLDVTRFENGIDYLHMALGHWGSMLLHGTAGAAESGLADFHQGVQLLIESQTQPDPPLDLAMVEYGLVA